MKTTATKSQQVRSVVRAPAAAKRPTGKSQVRQLPAAVSKVNNKAPAKTSAAAAASTPKQPEIEEIKEPEMPKTAA